MGIGWHEGFLTDGRPYRAACWVVYGMTMITFFISSRDLEDYDNTDFARLLAALAAYFSLSYHELVADTPSTE